MMGNAVASQNMAFLGALLKDGRSDLSTCIRPQVVGLHASNGALLSQNGQWTLSLTANLLARMWPLVGRVQLEIEEDAPLLSFIPMLEGKLIGNAVSDLVSAIDCGVICSIIQKEWSDSDIRVSVGHTTRRSDVQVASDGWLVFLNRNVNPSSNSNPVGAYLAACLAVSEAFKYLLRNHRLIDALKRPISFQEGVQFSAYDYSINNLDAHNPILPQTATVGPLLVAGVGSGGSATVLTLSAVSGSTGPFALIDPDEIIERNLQRYPFALRRHAQERSRKVEIGGELLGCVRGNECYIQGKSYEECSEELRHRGYLDLVVGTVHTGTARRVIQKDLPRVLIDGAVTENGEAVIRRVFFGESACMGCFYPRGEIYKETTVLAQAMGLEVAEVEELIRLNGTFTENQVNRIQERIDTPPAVGERLSDWRQQCAKLPLFVEDQSTEVPAAFATAITGVLIAGEVLKERLFPEAVLRSYYLLDTLGRFSSAYPYLRRPCEECDICGDPDMRGVYQRRYQQ